MKRILIMAVAAACAVSFSAEPAVSRVVTRDEARTVAANYITLVIGGAGSWGGSPYASVREVEEIRRGERLLGYWCHIEPSGHVVVSLHSELSPIKASSETWDGDPACDLDLLDVIKYKIEQEHDYIEARLGPIETAPADAVAQLLEFSNRDAWTLLSARPEQLSKELVSNAALADYEENTVLLTTNWRQGDPYNLYMPWNPVDCSESYGYRCAAGCVAIGAAQIMKYWNWPPYGVESPYDDYYYWTAMPDALTPSSPFEQINPVAVLLAEIGQACLMDYCCDGGCISCAWHSNMLSAYVANFRFHPAAAIIPRAIYPSDVWFTMIKDNLNMNMPLQYEVPKHSIVCDGWRVISGIRQYHMNYGWANYVPDDEACWTSYLGIGSNSWFTLDGLPCTDLSLEGCIAFLRPAGSLDGILSGTYAALPYFPWRYINMDARGESATFIMGHLIQSLPGMTVGCTSTTGGSVRFYGGTDHHTRIFTRGDWTKGVKITQGCVALYGPAAMAIR